MKPAPFEYMRAASVADAVGALTAAGGEAKILAGGQSLVPLLALRMARPAMLVDINRVPGLAGFSDTGRASVRVGALVRHSALARQESHPLLAEAARWIGHPAIRSRGTVGGSLAHADPAAELPVVAVALDAVAHVTGPAGGRAVTAAGLFTGALQNSLADDEIITAVDMPVPDRWGFAEFSRRRGDFGLVTVAVADLGGHLRIAVGGVAGVPQRPEEAEALLAEGPLTANRAERAAAAAAAGVNPPGDIHATAGYRRALVAELARRALGQAMAAPRDGGPRRPEGTPR